MKIELSMSLERGENLQENEPSTSSVGENLTELHVFQIES
jgi:hypothetical protein